MPVLAMRVNESPRAVATGGNSDSHELTDAILAVLGRLGSQKVLAGLMDLSESQFSRQKEGKDGHYLHVQRLDKLPPTFIDELTFELARRRGLRIVHADMRKRTLGQVLVALGNAMEELEGEPQLDLPITQRRAR